jgi:hypothetical protein
MNLTGGGNGGNGGTNAGGVYVGDGAGGGGGGLGGGVGGNGGSGGTNNTTDGQKGGTAQTAIIDNPAQVIYKYVKKKLGILAAYPGGAGDDTLDGGPGSDHLFGMGGSNTFIFESDDTTSNSDMDTDPEIDTIYDWKNGSANKIKLTTGGKTLTNAQITAIITAQKTVGNDRTIEHGNGVNKVKIVVKDIKEDLVLSDFIVGAENKKFPWTMFLPAILSSK